ncbi:hypothetical protein [Micromonospora sp. NPDC050695]|uniref:hypothetical protein n=1 Tax=Micromonospora sp. NPDC050695 TaxID=3154938 RepID=UPI0033C68F45
MANIIASASVPPEYRLDDADTTDLTALQRPADTRWPINQARPATVGVSPMVALNSGEGTGVTTDPSEAADLALVQAALVANPAAVRELADAIRRSGGLDFNEGYAHGYADGLRRALDARPAGCPSYCSDDHRGQVTEVDGFSIGLVHERMLADLTAEDPAWSDNRPATARVFVESTTERGEVITPTRVVLSIAEGDRGSYPGSEDTQGWTGTPDEVEQLGYALLSAARIARHA